MAGNVFFSRYSKVLAVSMLPMTVFAGGFGEVNYHPQQTVKFGSPDDQSLPYCCKDPCKPENHVRYLRDNFPDFYEIVTQNSPKSQANKRSFLLNGMVEFSGMANFDLQFSDRQGGPEPNSLYGVAVRPLFAAYDKNFIGSINNANLFVDAAVNNWVNMHFDFAYVNGSRRVRTYSNEDADWGSIYRPASGLHVNQANLTFANPAVWPIYFQIGRINHPFGDYESFPMTPSLTQLLSEIRTGGVVLGIVCENGLYGSVQWTMSQTSLENFNGSGALDTFGNNKDRNYGAKLGFRSCFADDWIVHVNAAYIADIRDADYLLEGENYYNRELRKASPAFDAFLLTSTWAKLTRAEGLSLHGDVEYCGCGLSANYVSALGNLNADPLVKNSKVYAWDVTGHVKFSTFGCPSRFTLGYQASDHSEVYEIYQQDPTDFGGGGVLPPTPIQFVAKPGRILPSDRITAGYALQVMPNVIVGVEWVHDRDFDEKDGGTGDVSNFGIIRVSAEF